MIIHVCWLWRILADYLQIDNVTVACYVEAASRRHSNEKQFERG
jgi:hypothetical protein